MSRKLSTDNVQIQSGQYAGKYGRLTGSHYWSNVQNCNMWEIEIGRQGRRMKVAIPDFRLDRFTKEIHDAMAKFQPIGQ